MPHIRQIKINDFRNLGTVSILPGPRTNVIFGENGAGKSSLLESISVIAHGRSFRTRKFRHLIRNDAASFSIHAQIDREVGGEIPVGVMRDRRGVFKIKVEENLVSTAAALATNLPLIVINAQSFQMIEGSPKDRRRFFDWLVFHVKHEFAHLWSQVSRCIKQRNSLLRRDKIAPTDIEPWDREIAQLSREIEKCRVANFALWMDAFKEILRESGSNGNAGVIGLLGHEIAMKYQSGWKEGASYEDQLSTQRERDRGYGYTTLGPHKADIKITCGPQSQPAAEILSRGQQKLLISALFIAQAKVLSASVGVKPIFAIDDMPSELDLPNQQILRQWLDDLDSQVFITGINKGFAEQLWQSNAGVKMFHVKHGQISEQQTK